uniref:Uncharacterized protein n=1 Tax=Arundo donax TaxID=35708 RepID=A0A0A9AYK8_ARUDO
MVIQLSPALDPYINLSKMEAYKHD